MAASERMQDLPAGERIHAKATVLGGPLDQVLPPFLEERRVDLLITGRRCPQEVTGIFGLHRDLIDTLRRSPCPAISV